FPSRLVDTIRQTYPSWTHNVPRQAMQCRTSLGVLISGAALFTWALLGGGRAAAQEEGPLPCLEQLAKMSWPDLEQLYRHAAPAHVPPGFLRGKAVYCQESRLAGPRAAVTNFLWHGKHFRDDCTLVNQWCGFKAIKARVYPDTSWLDGGPALIMDYS